MSTWRGGRRRVLAIASIATAVAVVVIGGVATAVTLKNQNHTTASLTSSHVVPVKAVAAVTPPVAASKCTTPTAFTFSGTLSAAAPGTVTYRWVYSSGKPGPVETVRFPDAGTKEVTGSTVKSEKAGGGWGEIKVISPVAPSSKQAAYKLLCGGGTVGGITATAAVTPATRTASCTTAPPGFTATGSIRASRAERVTYYWAQSDGVNSAPATLTFTKPGTQATQPLTIPPPAASGSGTAVLVVTKPDTTASSPATYTLTCGATATQPGTKQTAPPTAPQPGSTGTTGSTGTVTQPAPPVSVTVSAPATAIVGQAYSGTATATGGNGTYTWSELALPPGVTATANGGTLTLGGAPTQTGTWTVYLTASDSESPARQATQSVAITVGPVPLQIYTAGLQDGTVGSAYFDSIGVTATVEGTFTWSVTGLPPGLTFNPALATINGTPTQPGTYSVAVTVWDSAFPDNPASRTYPLVINPAS
jgi:hypothetical protein